MIDSDWEREEVRKRTDGNCQDIKRCKDNQIGKGIKEREKETRQREIL